MNKLDIIMKDLMIEIKTQDMKVQQIRKLPNYQNSMMYNYSLGIYDGLKKAYRIVKYNSI